MHVKIEDKSPEYYKIELKISGLISVSWEPKRQKIVIKIKKNIEYCVNNNELQGAGKDFISAKLSRSRL